MTSRVTSERAGYGPAPNRTAPTEEGGELLSVRMRASSTHEEVVRHISGAERICTPNDLGGILEAMAWRALRHPLGPPEEVKLTIERLSEVREVATLPVITTKAASESEGRLVALQGLCAAGVPEHLAASVMETIASGPGPAQGNMRGAMIVCVESGQRLEHDRARGVRATRMDVTAALRAHLRKTLPSVGAKTDRTIEALCVASKMILQPGVIAEYCCSDDPDYEGGYVASSTHGYVRIGRLKPPEHPKGGRAIFVSKVDIAALSSGIERAAVVFNRFPGMGREMDFPALLSHLERPEQTALFSEFR
jgi:6-carboxyhexanoate--CoA ligase